MYLRKEIDLVADIFKISTAIYKIDNNLLLGSKETYHNKTFSNTNGTNLSVDIEFYSLSIDYESYGVKRDENNKLVVYSKFEKVNTETYIYYNASLTILDEEEGVSDIDYIFNTREFDFGTEENYNNYLKAVKKTVFKLYFLNEKDD